jgi:hypothetical protein
MLDLIRVQAADGLVHRVKARCASARGAPRALLSLGDPLARARPPGRGNPHRSARRPGTDHGTMLLAILPRARVIQRAAVPAAKAVPCSRVSLS